MSKAASTAAASTLESIRRDISRDNPLLAQRLSPDSFTGAGFSDLFRLAAGRDGDTDTDYLRAIEYIFEGYLLHYGISRLYRDGDQDFNLLAGDYMYARGLIHITTLGNLVCIRLLADLISFCAHVHCERLDPALAADAWSVATLRIAAARNDPDTETGETGWFGEPAGGSEEGARLEATLAALIDGFSSELSSALRNELCNIYASLNQLRRPDGTE